jgi:PAS domain S-box-containing protein
MKTLDEIRQETILPAVITNHFGFITYVNEPFQAAFGWSTHEIIGQSLSVIIPSSYHDSHNLGFARFAMTEHARVLNHPLQLKAVTKDGQEVLSEHYITAECHQGQWLFGAIVCPLNHTSE